MDSTSTTFKQRWSGLMQSLPLSDLTVLDLSGFVSGPYCTKLLADLGAEIIKIERPQAGDISRRIGPFPGDHPEPEASGLFLYLNENKKSITLDWETRAGYQILNRLLMDSDVLVENMEPKTVDFDSLCSANPSLIAASISYFGSDGPYSSYRGSDIVAQALGGIMKLTGLPDREPLKIAGLQAEYQAGINAAIATMGALFSRSKTGKGQHIDIAVMECLAYILEGALLSYEYNGSQRERAGPRHPTVCPSTILPCRDGYLHVDAGANWDTFARFTCLPGLDQIEPEEVHHRADEIDALLLPWLSDRNKDDVFHEAQEWRLPFAPVNRIDEVFSDPQLQSRGFFCETDHPVAGKLAYPTTPFIMDGYRPEMKRAPLLGEHNQEIYCNRLGYNPREIARLRAMGVV